VLSLPSRIWVDLLLSLSGVWCAREHRFYLEVLFRVSGIPTFVNTIMYGGSQFVHCGKAVCYGLIWVLNACVDQGAVNSNGFA